MTKHERVDVLKRSIEVQIDEYERAVDEAAKWWAEWKRRHGKFRCKRAEAA